jgi:hypothetical protein
MLNDESEKCWICDKQVYTLIFFNPTDVAKPESIFMKDYEARAHIQSFIAKVNQESAGPSELFSSFGDALSGVGHADQVHLHAKPNAGPSQFGGAFIRR